MKNGRILFLTILLLLGLQSGSAQSSNGRESPLTFKITADPPSGMSDASLFVRIKLTAPGLPEGYGTRLKWAYPPYKSDSTWSGFSRHDDLNHMSLMFVALTGQPATGGYPPFFAMSALQRNIAGDGSNSSVFVPLEAKNKTAISDILTITIKDGEYRINQWIIIGTLSDHPIYLAVCLPATEEMPVSENKGGGDG